MVDKEIFLYMVDNLNLLWTIARFEVPTDLKIIKTKRDKIIFSITKFIIIDNSLKSKGNS